jgi:hypothetical protein
MHTFDESTASLRAKNQGVVVPGVPNDQAAAAPSVRMEIRFHLSSRTYSSCVSRCVEFWSDCDPPPVALKGVLSARMGNGFQNLT